MSRLQVIGLGLCTIDVLMRLEAMPVWDHGGPVPGLLMDGGGPVATGIVAAARLGAHAGYVGTYAGDETGQYKMALLARDGVDTSRAVSRPGVEQQIAICYVHAVTGERIFAMPEDFGAGQLCPEELDRDYLTQADFLHLDGFHYAAALHAAEWMHAAGKQVMLDAGKTSGKADERMRTLVQATDVLICGSGFGPGLTGEADLWAAGEALLALGPRIVVQTEGEDGSYTVTRDGQRFHTPAFRICPVDTTGAGDVFHGAYLFGLLQGWDVQRIATFASAVSAIKCGRLGGRVGIPRYAEVVAFLQEHGLAVAE